MIKKLVLVLAIPVLLSVVHPYVFLNAYPVPPKGSAVVITGASSGIGHDAALYLAGRGYVVFGTVRSKRQANLLKQEGAKVGDIRPVILDVLKESDISALVRIVSESGLPLGCLINNAGIAVFSPIELFTNDMMERQLGVNVVGAFKVTRAFLPLLRQHKGRIIQVSSMGADLTNPAQGMYSASKAALESMSYALRIELYNAQVSVSVVAPGPIQSEIWKKLLSHASSSPSTKGYYGWFSKDAYNAVLEEVNSIFLLSSQATNEAFENILTSARPPRKIWVCHWALRLWVSVYMHLPDSFQEWTARSTFGVVGS